jgi:predicted nucleotidyltransferase
MTRSDALAILRREKPRLVERYGIKRIGLFGSVARDEAHSGSDVDVVLEVAVTGVGEYFRLIEEIESAFPVPVDVVRLRPDLRPFFLQRLERDGVYV